MRIDGATPLLTQGRSQDASALSGVTKGDVIQAEVVSQKGEILTLKTQDGREFTAKAQEGTAVRPGDVLRFAVTGRAESGEWLVQIRKGAPAPHELLAMLKTDVSRASLALADAFVKAGRIPTKQQWQELSALLAAHKTLTARQAVFMLENKMPIHAQSIRSFQAFLQGQNGLEQALTQLGQVLDGLLAEPEAGAQPAAADRFAVSKPQGQPEVRPNTGASRNADAQSVPPPRGGSVKAGAQTLWQTKAGQPQTPVVRGGPSVVTALAQPGEARQAVAAPDIQGKPPMTAPQAPQTGTPLRTAADWTAPVDRPVPGGSWPQTDCAAPPQTQPAVPSGAAGQAQAPSAAPPRASGSFLPQTETPALGAQPDAGLSAREVVVQARQMLNALFREVAGRSADTLSGELTGVKTAKDLAAVLQLLNTESLPQTARQAVARAGALAAGALQLSEQMAPSAAVVPIPLIWQQHKTVAELFVLEDKPRQGPKIDPANATLFIALGTRHMGRVETLVKVVGRHVECALTSEKEQAVTVIEQHGEELGERLREEGYRLVKMTAQQRTAPANLLTVQARHRDKLRRTRFDESI